MCQARIPVLRAPWSAWSAALQRGRRPNGLALHERHDPPNERQDEKRIGEEWKRAGRGQQLFAPEYSSCHHDEEDGRERTHETNPSIEHSRNADEEKGGGPER